MYAHTAERPTLFLGRKGHVTVCRVGVGRIPQLPWDSQLRGEDPVEHGLLQAWRPEDEDSPQHIEDKVAVWPGADEPGLQE